VFWLGKASDWSVIVINFALRYLVIWLVKIFSYKTRSQESRDILIFIFIIQFFNTGPFLLLANADMSDSGIPLLSKFFIFGQHRDFTVSWYKDVGKIVINAMIL
jgi:hypothetical protein